MYTRLHAAFFKIRDDQTLYKKRVYTQVVNTYMLCVIDTECLLYNIYGIRQQATSGYSATVYLAFKQLQLAS